MDDEFCNSTILNSKSLICSKTFVGICTYDLNSAVSSINGSINGNVNVMGVQREVLLQFACGNFHKSENQCLMK